MSDLKKVYQAINEDEALNALLEFKEKWQKSYPSCMVSGIATVSVRICAKFTDYR